MNYREPSLRDFDQHCAGLLYADVPQYIEGDEASTHQCLVDGLSIMRIAIAATRGEIAYVAGEAILAQFKDADSALHCAINVQLAARQWNATLNPAQQIRFRIGINFGRVIVTEGVVCSKAANIAAQLEGLALPGGICVSRPVRENLHNRSRIKFISLGKQYLKNINDPADAFWIQIDDERSIKLDLPGLVKLPLVNS